MTSFRDFLMEANYDIYKDLDNYVGGEGIKYGVITLLNNEMVNNFGEKLIKNKIVKVEHLTSHMITTAGVLLKGTPKETTITYMVDFSNAEAYLEKDVNPKKVQTSIKHLEILSKLTSLPLDLLKASKVTIDSDLTPAWKTGQARTVFKINIKAPKNIAFDAISKLNSQQN